MQTITFFSYKGGTGRSLAVANVAHHLARFGLKVVTLDFDLEAPGLHYKFNVNDNESGESDATRLGVVDYFHYCITHSKIPSNLSDYIASVPLPEDWPGSIDLMSAGAAPNPKYWEKLSAISWHELFYVPGAKGAPLFLELKERIRDELEPDFLLIDSRTGITEIGGALTTLLSDRIVCLLLANKENLEGTRAVLRGIKGASRLPDMNPIEFSIVLSRIPPSLEREREESLLGEIKDFLNEESEDLRDTLGISEVFVFHSEPELQVAESLRIGGKVSPDESVLLRDYLRLFASIIPMEKIVPNISRLAQRIKIKAFDDPEAAEEEMKALTQLGHPEAYKEMLKFQRLRKTSSLDTLRTAQRLWELQGNEKDPLIWETVQREFEEIFSYRKPDWVDVSFLCFIEGAWRDAGARDVRVGRALAETYDNFREPGLAADVLVDLLKSSNEDEEVIVHCLRQLERAERSAEARDLINRYREPLKENNAFLDAWAEYALEHSDQEYIEELSQPPFINRIARNDIRTAHRILAQCGKIEEAENLVLKSFEEALKEGPSRQLEHIGRVLTEMGKGELFERRLKGTLGEERAERFLRDTDRMY